MGLLSAASDVFVGLGFRAVLWAIMTIIGVAYTVVYANRIAKDPAKSLVHGVDVSDLVLDTSKDVTVTGRHVAVLLSILAAMIMTVIGMQKGFGGVKWGIDDVSAVFLASALFSGIVGKLHPSEIANSFVKGAGGAVGGVVAGLLGAKAYVMGYSTVLALPIFQDTIIAMSIAIVTAIVVAAIVTYVLGFEE